MAKPTPAPVKSNDPKISLYQLVILLEVVFLLVPPILISVGILGSQMIFPGYIVFSVLTMAAILFYLRRIESAVARLPWFVLILAVLLKLIILEAILLYFFTPLLDYVGVSFAWQKMCNDTAYFAQTGSPNNQIVQQLCTNGIMNLPK